MPSSQARKAFAQAAVRLCLYGAAVTGLSAALQTIIVGIADSHGLAASVAWGMFVFILPCAVMGAALGAIGILPWLLARKLPMGVGGAWTRAAVVGVITGAVGAYPIGGFIAKNPFRVDLPWGVPLTGIYLAVMFGGFVLWWERRNTVNIEELQSEQSRGESDR